MVHHLPWTKPASIARINGPTVTSQYLLTALHQARRNKTDKEVEFMRRASEITADAHLALMRGIGSGEVTDENAAEALFVGVCRKAG
jgi:Xaa-Pro dipeptidase